MFPAKRVSDSVSVSRSDGGMNVEHLQELHYNAIGSAYESHYGDSSSQRYREKFIYTPMFEGLELSGLNVLEAMCGSGQTTAHLLSQGAKVTGLDISRAAIDSFEARWSNCEVQHASILSSGFPSSSFDCVVTVGGLHHLQPNVVDALVEIHRILKAGGTFCFAEPHTGSLPDIVRAFWYKHDRWFASNEASIDLEELKPRFADRFRFKKEAYLGSSGYLLVLNSMIFRIPVRFKPWYASLAMASESVISRFQRKWSSCFVVSQWQKL